MTFERILQAEQLEAPSGIRFWSFVDGQRDCRIGVPHQDGKGEDYDRGYAFEYFLQEQRANG